MSDHPKIYLQPECCADNEIGRLWCDHDAPEDCEDGAQWTEYVRADIARSEAQAVRNQLISCHKIVCTADNCVLDGGAEHQSAFEEQSK